MPVNDLACPLDLDEGLSRAGGEQDFYKELLELLLEDVPPRLDDLRAAVAAGQPAKVASIAHAIKGAAANLAAVALKDAAYRLETKGREGQAAGLEPDVDRLVAEFERLAAFVKTY